MAASAHPLVPVCVGMKRLMEGKKCTKHHTSGLHGSVFFLKPRNITAVQRTVVICTSQSSLKLKVGNYFQSCSFGEGKVPKLC